MKIANIAQIILVTYLLIATLSEGLPVVNVLAVTFMLSAPLLIANLEFSYRTRNKK
ncbi:hypothetical protein [Priestia filamentosa]|uniref:hypothetical protein n=1 Tax=Priestia filamentosa TaxID=1402861 RepID=UPI000A603A9C|nr:hypothetical protein [Priestia filamentosa]